MKALYITIVALLMGYHHVKSATIQVSNQTNNTTWISSLQDAIDMASIGDTILVAKSHNNYGTVTIDKPLTIIGKYSLVTRFIVKSSNVRISGFEASFDLNTFGAPNQLLENVKIEDCKSFSFNFVGANIANPAQVKNMFISNNVFNGFNLDFSCCSATHFDGLLITNNIFTCTSITTSTFAPNISGIETITIRNNNFFNSSQVFAGAWDSLNIENNIFYLANPQTMFSSSYSNNLVFGSNFTISDTNDVVLNNIIGIDPEFTTPPVTCNDEADYTLRSFSPALGAGSDGTDIGITGGAYPFTEWTLPDWPNVELAYTNESGVLLGTDMELTFTPTGTSDSQVDYVEYFIDEDITPGSGTPIPVVSGDETPQSFVVPASVYGSTGFYRVYVRVRDTAGRYSIAECRRFYVYDDIVPPSPAPSPDIVSAEYFIDTDPGVGSGTSIPLTSGNPVTHNFTVDMTGLSQGFHYFYVRVFDMQGRASIAERKRFYVFDDSSPPPPPVAESIVAAEYFIDTDPGVGNGEAISITAGVDILDSLTIDLTGIEPGYHYLYVRMWDALGRPSIAERERFYVFDTSPPIVDTTSYPIVYAEYFLDTDPGVGNAEAITLNDSTDIQMLSIPMVGRDTGVYHLYVRARDQIGRYSIAERQEFYIGPAPTAMVDTFGVDSLILPFNPGFVLDVLANDSSTFPIQNTCDSLTAAIRIVEPPTQGTVVLDSTSNCSRLKYIHNGAAGWDSLQYAVCDSLNLCDTASVFLKIFQPLDSLDEPVVLDELTFSWEGLTPAEIEDRRMLLDSTLNGELIESCNCNKLDRWRFRDSIGININEKKEQARESTGLDGVDISFNYIREVFDPPKTWNTVLEYPESTDTGQPVAVAVVDSGIDSTAIMSFEPLYDGVDTCSIFISALEGYNALEPGESPNDLNGHGTHIAEILKKESNDLIELYFVKVVDSTGEGTMFHTICGIHKAIDEGVKVINLSLGYQGEESLLFREVVDKAQANDVILVVSAGNDTLDIDAPGIGYWPSNFEHPNIISVGANNPRNEKCLFTNSGFQSVDLFAPGRDIESRELFGGNSVVTKSGTSQAAALVSRQVAILRSQFPDSTYAFIKDTLFSSLEMVEEFMPLSVTGGILPGFSYTGDTIVPPLPIELIYFNARPNDTRGSIDLSWEVTTESTVDKFIVEYARNAVDFGQLAVIPFTKNKWNYIYTHADAQPNMTHFYRLKMVEPDGKITYSDIQAASLIRADYNPVSIHPNPINGATKLKFEGFTGGKGQLMVYDSYGRLLVQQNILIQEGGNDLPLNVNGLSAGLYTLQLLQGEYRWMSLSKVLSVYRENFCSLVHHIKQTLL